MESHDRETVGMFSTASLLRSMGSLTKTSGRGLLMFRTMAVGSTAAALAGLCGAYIGGIFVLGASQLFVISSTLAFGASTWYHYRSQVRQAFMAFDSYPELMRLHLMMNFPAMRFQTLDIRPEYRQCERARFMESRALTDMLTSAYQTASPAIDEILLRREQNMITALSEQSIVDGDDSLTHKLINPPSRPNIQ